MFESALAKMSEDGADFFPPTSFRKYAAENELGQIATASIISVDSRNGLAKELRAAKVMVFRLGKGENGQTTKFALAKCKNGWSDYFLEDNELFSAVPPQPFVPACPARALCAFQLLPRLTETSFVNLALASGLIGSALGVDEPDRLVIPATGQSTFTFRLRPHPSIAVDWLHSNGQVEIDALFLARRNGRETLFVVEAKTAKGFDSLAKHKLVYPVLALRSKVPDNYEIAPVYLKTLRVNDAYHFYICECTIEKGTEPVTVSSLVPRCAASHLVLHGINAESIQFLAG